MKPMIKILSVMFCLISYACLFPSASADADTIASGTCGDNVIWTLDDDGTLTISGTGATYDYGYYDRNGGLRYYDHTKLPWYSYRNSIASVEIEDGITRIGRGLFFESCLTSVSIPESVETIGHYAFYRCLGLDSIQISENLISIGFFAFAQCNNLKTAGPSGGNYDYEYGWTEAIPENAFSGCESMTNIVLPKGIFSIGVDAFYGCTGLTNVAIPESVTSIGGAAFNGCSSLTSVIIPSNVTSIGNAAFYDCYNLTDVTVPSSVTSIGDAFSHCSNLKTAGPINGNYNYKFGWTEFIPDSAFSNCTGLESVTIPNSIIAIGDYAFFQCSNLADITIPKSVTNIGSGAFMSCSNLKTAGPINGDYDYKYGWTESIPEKAFSDSGIESITIPNSVIAIGDYAFYRCSELTNITIPGNVTSIGSHTFSGCSNLETAGPIDGDYNYKFGWTESIPDNAFSNCEGLISVTIPDSITSIGNWAFYYCRKLTSITIPNGVTSIGQSTFNSCESLIRLTIPDSVTSIGQWAFYYCRELTSITVPNSVTSISSESFIGCSKLKTAGPVGGNYNYKFGWIESIPENAFSNCENLITITIPSSVVSIGDNAFHGCSQLKTAGPIGGNYNYRFGWTESIPNNAFSNSCLTSVTIPTSVMSIGNSAFHSCANLKSITIPNSVTSIGAGAFAYSGITSITIPDSVTTIGDVAFAFSQLEEASISNNVTTINDYTFWGCANLSSIIIPKGVTSIGKWAFRDCTELTSINIPNSVISISSDAFLNVNSDIVMTVIKDSYAYQYAINNNITYVLVEEYREPDFILPDNISSIEDSAFEGIAAIVVFIPDTCTNIGDHAFYNSKIEQIRIPAGCSVEDSAFDGCTDLIIWGTPGSSAEVYCTNHPNCTFLVE